MPLERQPRRDRLITICRNSASNCFSVARSAAGELLSRDSRFRSASASVEGVDLGRGAISDHRARRGSEPRAFIACRKLMRSIASHQRVERLDDVGEVRGRAHNLVHDGFVLPESTAHAAGRRLRPRENCAGWLITGSTSIVTRDCRARRRRSAASRFWIMRPAGARITMTFAASARRDIEVLELAEEGAAVGRIQWRAQPGAACIERLRGAVRSRS